MLKVLSKLECDFIHIEHTPSHYSIQIIHVGHQDIRLTTEAVGDVTFPYAARSAGGATSK